jgi:hypothetical protein
MQYKRTIGEICRTLHKRWLAFLVQETASSDARGCGHAAVAIVTAPTSGVGSRNLAHWGYHALLGLRNRNRDPLVCLQSLTCKGPAAYAAMRSISSGLGGVGDPPAIRLAIGNRGAKSITERRVSK